MTDRLIAVVLLLLGTACAQLQSDSSDMVRRLRVRVTFGDHDPCDSSTRVVLTGAMGFALAEGPVNGECTADFFDVPSGRYRVEVRGSDATNADDGDVEVNSVITQDVEVRARHSEHPDPNQWVSHASFISVTELAVPPAAVKEFQKANKLMAKQDWARAAERLQKGLAIYPKCAPAYNSLGGTYFHRGDHAQARQALERAIALDDHFAPAYANLGRLSFMEKDYPAAESFLSKAINLAPAADVDVLSMLAYAQVTDHHPDLAIATSRQAHAKFGQHAYLHLIAANAYEQQHRIADSVSELRVFLAEEPTDPKAEKVKTAIATLQAQMTSQASRQ